MGTQVTSADGTKTTELQSVSLEKQCNTYYQQSNNFQRWNSVSSKQFGLEETQQQEKHSWASATRSSEQEQLDACLSLKSTTNRCSTSSAKQDRQWHHHQHHKHNYNHRWFSIHREDKQQQQRVRHLRNKRLCCQHKQVDHNFHQRRLQTRHWQQQHQHWPTHQWPQHQQVATADQQCRHRQSDRWQTT